MRLDGSIDISLGGFICMRGFAPLKDLNKLSVADKSYQRNLIKHHQKEMQQFWEEKKYLFFPEVVLGGYLNEEFVFDDDSNLLNALTKGIKFEKQFDMFKLGTYKRLQTKSEETTSFVQTGHLFISDNLFKKSLLGKSFRPFARIDGNHRLSILDYPDDYETRTTDEKKEIRQEIDQKIIQLGNIKVPYCLVLFDTQSRFEQFSRVVFHNINYKQIPLTMEKNLNLILGDSVLFSDDDLMSDSPFGFPYYFARKMYDATDYDFNFIKPTIDYIDPETKEKQRKTFFVNILKLLVERKLLAKDDVELEKLKLALTKVNQIYASNIRLKLCTNQGVLGALIYYQIHNPQYVSVLAEWLEVNHLTSIKKLDMFELVEIFAKVIESKNRIIFVSMQFNINGVENRNYYTIKKALNEITGQDFELRPLRIDEHVKGSSYKISDEILEQIKNSGLLIVDLTAGNKNVYHELGYAMGLNRQNGIQNSNFILIHDSVTGSDKDFGFNIQDWQQIRFNNPEELERKLIVAIKAYYNIP